MSDAEHIPLTEKETEAFESIKLVIRDEMPVCLMRIVIDNKPEAVICVVKGADSEMEVDIIPLAVLVSDALFSKIDTPEGSTEVRLEKETNCCRYCGEPGSDCSGPCC